jgi:hypothetical protein
MLLDWPHSVNFTLESCHFYEYNSVSFLPMIVDRGALVD